MRYHIKINYVGPMGSIKVFKYHNVPPNKVLKFYKSHNYHCGLAWARLVFVITPTWEYRK